MELLGREDFLCPLFLIYNQGQDCTQIYPVGVEDCPEEGRAEAVVKSALNLHHHHLPTPVPRQSRVPETKEPAVKKQL